MAPVAHAEIRDAAFDARIDRGNVHRVAAPGAARSVSCDPVRIDFGAGLQVSNGVADVVRLPLWYHPATVVAFAVAPAAVIKAKASIVGCTELLEHHNVMLGVFKTEKAGPLDDSRKRLALIGVREIQNAAELVAFVIKIHLLCAHVRLLK